MRNTSLHHKPVFGIVSIGRYTIDQFSPKCFYSPNQVFNYGVILALSSSHTPSARTTCSLCWVGIWRFRRRVPPVYPIVIKKIYSTFRCVFGVIILEQSVRSRQLVSDEREKGLFNYLAENNSIHYAFKNTDPSPALATYSSPHMHFYGMLWSA